VPCACPAFGRDAKSPVSGFYDIDEQVAAVPSDGPSNGPSDGPSDGRADKASGGAADMAGVYAAGVCAEGEQGEQAPVPKHSGATAGQQLLGMMQQVQARFPG
jgi:hypothetical protein